MTVSADTPVMAHSTNSWFSSVPTTTRSFSVPSGIDPCHGAAASTVAVSDSHAIDRTRPAGSSIRPSGRISTAGFSPCHAKSSPESVEPSTNVSTSLGRLSALVAGREVRRTARTRSPGTESGPPGPSAICTPAASIRSSRPAVTVPSPCSTSTSRGLWSRGVCGGASAAWITPATDQMRAHAPAATTALMTAKETNVIRTTASPRRRPAV